MDHFEDALLVNRVFRRALGAAKIRAVDIVKGTKLLQNGVVYEVITTPRKRKVVNPKSVTPGSQTKGQIRWLIEFATKSIHGIESRQLWSTELLELAAEP